ncbi:MAG: tyrosinase family protein [Rhizomicrobium sp.]|jgi:hypothetical protein
MKLTRREVVSRAGALGTVAALAAVPAFGQTTEPSRMSLTDFVKDPARIDSLRRGVATMKARPASDHRSWFFQAAIHAYDDALYADALAHDPAVAQVDRARYWNKCTHFGQSSANFVVWHRAYLYYFERILRDAAGDPDLALPYWDYTKPENRSFPEIFADEYVDRAKRIPNPLYHSNRDLAFVIGTLGISDAVGRAATTVDSDIFFSDIGVTGFAGDILDSDETQVGLIEQRPHNDIHLAVGGVVGTANGAMADVRTAAFDPVFWVHHANIDRMWAEWSRKRGKGWGALPPDSWLDEDAWIFLDVDGKEKTNSRRFYIERASLPVRYDTDGLFGAALALPSPTPPPPPPPPPTGEESNRAPTETVVAPAMVKSAAPKRSRTLLADNVPFDVSPASPGAHVLGLAATPTESVGVAPPSQQGIRAPAPAAAAAPPPLRAPSIAANERVLLELSDISFDRVPSSGFAVYLIGSSANGSSEPVGLLNLFGATHMQMPTMKVAQRFDVTRIVAHSEGPFTLRIEPYDLLVSKAGASAPQRADQVHIGSVKFVVIS